VKLSKFCIDKIRILVSSWINVSVGFAHKLNWSFIAVLIIFLIICLVQEILYFDLLNFDVREQTIVQIVGMTLYEEACVIIAVNTLLTWRLTNS